MRKTCSVDGCDKQARKRGWCQGHYTRWLKYGDPNMGKQAQLHGLTLRERFLAYVNQSGGCWEWTGHRDANGYGRLSIGNRPILAHRISWELFCHEITPEQHVLHRCDNPPCVRPEHLFLGDQAMNVADMRAKKRQRYGVSRGEKHGCARLTEEQVRAIRASSGPSHEVASQFGISGRQVREIRARTAWKHIP